MKANLLKNLGSKPVLFGAFAVTVSALTLLPAWDVPDPGMDGEDVNIPDGRLVVSGPVISETAIYNNNVGDIHAVVAGRDNDLVRTGVYNDVGQGFVVGINNAFSTTALSSAYSGMIGSFNNARSLVSLTVGNSNNLTTSATNSSTAARFTSVFGYSNDVTGPSFCNLLIGEDNSVQSDHSFVAGDSNTIGGATSGTATNNSLAIGFQNLITANQSWTIGADNEITSNESAAFGTGLSADAVGCTFVGEFNAATGASLTTRASDEPVFVVGNGTADNARSTAVTVLRDGDVIITKRQGDISMGSFN